MAYYGKSFSYDARGCTVDSLKEKIDSDVSAHLTSESATHLNDLTVAVNDENVIVVFSYDDEI